MLPDLPKDARLCILAVRYYWSKLHVNASGWAGLLTKWLLLYVYHCSHIHDNCQRYVWIDFLWRRCLCISQHIRGNRNSKQDRVNQPVSHPHRTQYQPLPSQSRHLTPHQHLVPTHQLRLRYRHLQRKRPGHHHSNSRCRRYVSKYRSHSIRLLR